MKPVMQNSFPVGVGMLGVYMTEPVGRIINIAYNTTTRKCTFRRRNKKYMGR